MRILLLAAAAWAAIVLAVGAFGRALGDEQAALLYAAAWAQVPHYRLSERAPRVLQVDQARLRAIAGCARCDVRGYTIGADVYVDRALDFADPLQASMLLHEFVHVLQNAARGPARDCAEWVAREIEAYTAQLAVLEGAGVPVYAVKLAAQMQTRSACR